MAFIQRAIAAVFPAALAACVPHFTTYVHLRAPEGTFVPATCGNSGPPVFARYERNGAQFDVTLEPGIASRAQNGFIRVRAPAKVTVAIPDTAAYMSLENGDPPIRFRLKLAQTANMAGMVEQRFDFEGLPAKIDFGGTLHLPDVIVDGKPVVSPVFEFYRERYVGAAPANC
ncbi:MAG TPA: hypothetical protein VLH12_14895 [Usitatibacter sp.]|nr:hypothetical protein [Usitatibacter sp.]